MKSSSFVKEETSVAVDFATSWPFAGQTLRPAHLSMPRSLEASPNAKKWHASSGAPLEEASARALAASHTACSPLAFCRWQGWVRVNKTTIGYRGMSVSV